MRTRIGAATALLALVVTLVLATADPAAAHGGPGTLRVVSGIETGALQATYVVELTFAGDGDQATGATVTAVADLAGSPSVGPVTMNATTKGRYTATLTVPSAGSWTVRFTSIDPPATLAQAMAITAVAPPSSDVSTVTSGTLGETTASTTGPSTTGPSTTLSSSATTQSRDDSGSDNGALPWLIGGVTVIGVAVVVALFSRKRS